MNIHKITNNKHSIIMILLLSIYIPYTIIDYLSIPQFMGSGLKIGERLFDKFTLIPGDGIISSLEQFIFYLFLPSLFAMYFYYILIASEKRRIENEMPKE